MLGPPFFKLKTGCCLTCRNYDLCSICEERNEREPFHDEKHIFAKIKDTKTGYRAFLGGQHQAARSRIHGNACERSVYFRKAFSGCVHEEIRTRANGVSTETKNHAPASQITIS